MDTKLGISLKSCLYLKLAKTLCLSYYLLCFLFNKIGEEGGETGSAQKIGWLEKWVAQTMYTHVSKCKNDEIKERKKILKYLVSYFEFTVVSLSA
jgi:hypothetical protein